MQPLAAAFRHLTFQTGNIPMTEGYKMSLRHLGAALNIHDGPLAVFLTTNFADTYSPITVTLMNGAGEPLGSRTVNLLYSMPDMPTLREMHRALAKHPMIQAELFLLLDKLVLKLTHKHVKFLKNMAQSSAKCVADPTVLKSRVHIDVSANGMRVTREWCDATREVC